MTDLDRLEKRLRSMPGCTEYAAAIVRLRVENQSLEQKVASLRGIISGLLAVSERARKDMEAIEEGENA